MVVDILVVVTPKQAPKFLTIASKEGIRVITTFGLRKEKDLKAKLIMVTKEAYSEDLKGQFTTILSDSKHPSIQIF